MASVSDKPAPRVAIAAGGTGGHIAPALALAEALRSIDRRVELSFLCGDKPFERRMYEVAGHSPVVLASRPLSGNDPIAFARGAVAIGAATMRARRALSRIRPSVVVGMGGYVAAPALLAARMLGVPTCLHEQNAIPGRANRLLSRFATQTTAAHVAALEDLRGKRRSFLGNPVSRALLEADADFGRAKFGLSPDRPALLVLGGSQGAARLNEIVFEAAALMNERLGPEMAPQFLWAAGEKHAAAWKERAEKAGLSKTLLVHGFIDDMPSAYAAADLAIARAGAGTISEIAAVGLPAILVPYPHARDDHQTANARELSQAGGAMVECEGRLNPALLAARVEQLLFSPDRLRRMSAAAMAQARPHAAWEMARMVLDLALPMGELADAPEKIGAPHRALAV